MVGATRGKSILSIAFAAARHGLAATIVVPRGNSVEKNAAMRALGAELIEHGEGFPGRARARRGARRRTRRAWCPSFHADLVRGVASYWMEFFGHFTRGEAPEAVFVPIGLGSGICACAAARAATGVATRIVGVVSAHAQAYRLSFEAGVPVEAPVSTQLADGMACRVAEPDALAIIRREVDEIVSVSDDEVAQAMRALFADTHNVAERLGAAALAALLQQREPLAGRRVGLALNGGGGHARGVRARAFNALTSLFAVVVVAGLAGLADVANHIASRLPLLAAAFNNHLVLHLLRGGVELFHLPDRRGLARRRRLIGAGPKPAPAAMA